MQEADRKVFQVAGSDAETITARLHDAAEVNLNSLELTQSLAAGGCSGGLGLCVCFGGFRGVWGFSCSGGAWGRFWGGGGHGVHGVVTG